MLESTRVRPSDAARPTPRPTSTGEETCRKSKASLLVMGAYTHSRLRQVVLGGVTRHVLANAKLPLLMTH